MGIDKIVNFFSKKKENTEVGKSREKEPSNEPSVENEEGKDMTAEFDKFSLQNEKDIKTIAAVGPEKIAKVANENPEFAKKIGKFAKITAALGFTAALFAPYIAGMIDAHAGTNLQDLWPKDGALILMQMIAFVGAAASSAWANEEPENVSKTKKVVPAEDLEEIEKIREDIQSSAA